MAGIWVACTSKDHEGQKVYINLDRVDLMYRGDDETIVVMAGWDPDRDGALHIVEPPEVLIGGLYQDRT